MNKPHTTYLKKLFENWSNESAESIEKLPESGSSRMYYRISGQSKKAIGTFNEDRDENIAFIEFSRHFLEKKLPVPEIYAVDIESHTYLQQDIGNRTLFGFLQESRLDEDFPQKIIELYKIVLTYLPKFQITGSKGMDYSKCYPREHFDKQSMLWDLNYFKYYFLKLAGIGFNEQKLENDFHTLIDYLLDSNTDYFLYRDFQSRNIMLHEGQVYFIDYQGGRKGALHYDLASLLYDAKANIPQSVRETLIDHYTTELKKYISVDKDAFIEKYYGYVLIRKMQAMGAYGFRGFYEKKKHFLQSIPYALQNLAWILKHVQLPIEIPHLIDTLHNLTTSKKLKSFSFQQRAKSSLLVSINSFAYKNGIPEDTSKHGGGFVFDCRAIHNPGRYEQYKQHTGKDHAVIEFLENEEEMQFFLDNVFTIIEQSVEKYIQRDFSHLMVNFGCTGGQHRSVFAAEKLAKHLRANYSIQVNVWHRELE